MFTFLIDFQLIVLVRTKKQPCFQCFCFILGLTTPQVAFLLFFFFLIGTNVSTSYNFFSFCCLKSTVGVGGQIARGTRFVLYKIDRHYCNVFSLIEQVHWNKLKNLFFFLLQIALILVPNPKWKANLKTYT